jgi:urease accessory protein
VLDLPENRPATKRHDMIRATKVFPSENWSHAASDRVVLDYDGRHRRRFAMTGEKGTEFLLDLAEATALRGGDGLLLEDGRIVEVLAAAEPLAEIGASDGAHLLRLAWHLGNRHLPTQILGDRLRIRRDHVIEEMLVGLGAKVMQVSAPFDPEGGAYGHETHGHDQDHDHGDHHGHRHDHG